MRLFIASGDAVGSGVEIGVGTGVAVGVDCGVGCFVDIGVDAGVDPGVGIGVDSGVDCGVGIGVDAVEYSVCSTIRSSTLLVSISSPDSRDMDAVIASL